MRFLSPILQTLLAIAAVAAVGWIAFAAAGINAHPRDLTTAAAIALAAAVAGLAPLWLTIGTDQLAAAQAGLVATTAHLFVAAGLAGAVYLMKVVPVGPAFAYWLLAMYAATLVVVAASAVKGVRLARPAAAAPVAGPAAGARQGT
jgi:hypothetical protein